jgi:hypothetical protein
VSRGSDNSKEDRDTGLLGDDAALAVIAHGLLNSISAIQMGAHALRESWETISTETRDEILGLLTDQAAHVRGVLQDLIRGLPPEIVRALNDLSSPDRG